MNSPLANALTFTVLWAFQIFVAKLAYLGGAEVVPFCIQSGVITLLTLFLLVGRQVLRELPAVPARTLSIIFGANALHFAVGGVLSGAGMLLTSAINAGFVVQFSTVTTTTFAWLILGEPLTRSKLVTVSMIMAGTFLLVTNGELTSPAVGDLLILCACCSWSLANVLVRRTLRASGVTGELVTLLRPVAGLPVLLLLASLGAYFPSAVRPMFEVERFHPQTPVYTVMNGILVGVMWLFLNRTLKVASASYMTMMCSLTPVIVAALAIGILGDRLTPVQAIGAAIVVFSGIVTQWLKLADH